MEFNWINIFGGAIVALMLIPNIIYGLKIGNKEQSEPWLKLAALLLLCVKNTRNTLSIPVFLCLD